MTTSDFFLQDQICSLDLRVVSNAREIYVLSGSDAFTAMKQIQKLCYVHRDNALLFRTQAEILEKCCDEAIELDRKSILMKSALQSARKATTLNPNSMDFSSFLGHLLYKRSVNSNDYREAFEQFNAALNIPRPSDPAQETLLTDEEIQALSPTYQARIKDKRKCILMNLGDCLFQLKILSGCLLVRECLRSVEVNDEDELVQLAWYSWNLNAKRHYLEEEVEDTERSNAMRKAREAYLLAAFDLPSALKQIRECCVEQCIALLFQTQAEILEKCYDEATVPDKKAQFMDDAIQCAREAIYLSPSSMIFSSFLGHLFCRRSVGADGYKNAIRQFNNALNIPRPSDPAQETLLTDEEVLAIFPTYEARVEDARKGILRRIGDCFLILKKLKSHSCIEECLQTVEVNTNEERLHVAWYSLSLDEKRQLLKEHLGGTVRTSATKKYDAATGTEEVLCSLKMKDPIDKLPLPGGQDTVGVPGAEEFEAYYVEILSFERLVQSRYNLVILTGDNILMPNCCVNHIVQEWQETCRVFRNGPMALVITAADLVQRTLSRFPEKCKAVGLTSRSDMIGSAVVVTTSEQLRSYILFEKDEHDFDGIAFVVIENFHAVFSSSSNTLRQSIFKSLAAAQVVVVNSEYTNDIKNSLQLLSGPAKILDLAE